jgi:outer membrane protein assembly factor BamB
VKTGTYACNISNDDSFLYTAVPVAISPDSYISFWWRTDTAPNDSDNTVQILRIFYSGDGGSWKLYDNSTMGDINLSYFPLAITANVWYNVTIHFQKDESTGSTNSTVWIDSALREKLTGIDTFAEPDDTIRFFRMPSTGTVTIDDVQVYTLSGIPAPSPSSDWPMYQHDVAHTGYSNCAPAGGPVPLWNFTAGEDIVATPAVVNGVVYVGDTENDDHFYAINATNGAQIWGVTWTHSSFESSPAIVHGIIYVGVGDGYFYALNTTDGSQIWSYAIPNSSPSANYCSPTVADGIVYIGGADGKIYALDASNGGLIWTYTTGDSVESSPAVVNGVVYVGSDDYNLYALNAYTGVEIWIYHTNNRVYSTPAVANGKVYVGSWDGNVSALDAATGTLIWNYTSTDSVSSSPAIYNGVVYIGSQKANLNGILYALNANTGAQIWNYTSSGDSPITGGVTVVNGAVYYSTWTGYLMALDASSGSQLWNYSTGVWEQTSPAVVNGVLYWGAENHYVYAFGTSLSPVATPTPTPGGGGGGGFGGNPTPTPTANGNGGGGGFDLLKTLKDLLSKIPPWALWAIVAILIIVGLAGIAKGDKKKGGAPQRSFSPSYGGM